MSKSETINITPEPQGYATMAAMFAEQILGCSRAQDRERAAAFLDQVVRITAHLAYKVGTGDNADKNEPALDWLMKRVKVEEPSR